VHYQIKKLPNNKRIAFYSIKKSLVCKPSRAAITRWVLI
jgi:hypothetical protein